MLPGGPAAGGPTARGPPRETLPGGPAARGLRHEARLGRCSREAPRHEARDTRPRGTRPRGTRPARRDRPACSTHFRLRGISAETTAGPPAATLDHEGASRMEAER